MAAQVSCHDASNAFVVTSALRSRAKFKALPLILRSHSQPQQLELWLEAQNESWRLSALRLQMHFWLTTR